MFEQKLNKFSAELQRLFSRLNDILLTAVPIATARLWGGLPSYYVEQSFVRLIPLKDHINIEAAAFTDYAAQLKEYEFTPKNMLQLFVGQAIPAELLTAVFKDTLLS